MKSHELRGITRLLKIDTWHAKYARDAAASYYRGARKIQPEYLNIIDNDWIRKGMAISIARALAVFHRQEYTLGVSSEARGEI